MRCVVLNVNGNEEVVDSDVTRYVEGSQHLLLSASLNSMFPSKSLADWLAGDVTLTSVRSYLGAVDTVPCSGLNHLVSVSLPPAGGETLLGRFERGPGKGDCLPEIFHQIIPQISH